MELMAGQTHQIRQQKQTAVKCSSFAWRNRTTESEGKTKDWGSSRKVGSVFSLSRDVHSKGPLEICLQMSQQTKRRLFR